MMDFALDLENAQVRVKLTDLGKDRYANAVARLECFNPQGPIPALAIPDSQGYYTMPAWVLLRTLGGDSVLGPEWFEHFVVGEVHVLIPTQETAPVLYPG